MSSSVKSMLRVATVVSIVALALGGRVVAQNPPAHGMVWSKAAPFPDPDEELYGSVINGKFYVVGGFFQIPNPNAPAAAAMANHRSSGETSRRQWSCPRFHQNTTSSAAGNVAVTLLLSSEAT